MKLNLSLLTLTLSAALAGCGGGSDSPANASGTDTSGSSNTQAAISNTGSVEAPFVRGPNARYFLMSVAMQSFGTLSTHTQETNGAIAQLGTASLTGTPNATQEIAGNATFAQGRWNVGTVTTSVGVTTMDGTTNQSFHYLAFNELPSLPTSGALNCSAGKFTAPSYIGGTHTSSKSEYVGTSTGSGSIAFDSSGAHVTLNIVATSGNDSATANLAGTVTSQYRTYSVGNLGGLTTAGLVSLGEGANGSVILASFYKVQLGNGRAYQGIASFVCQ